MLLPGLTGPVVHLPLWGPTWGPPTSRTGAPKGAPTSPMGPQEGAPGGDKEAPTGDKGAPTGDKGAPTGDKGAPSGDKGAPSGDKGAPSVVGGAPSVGYGSAARRPLSMYCPLAASSSLPRFSPELPCAYVTEGLADALLFEAVPYRSAISEGATHVLVLRSRPDKAPVARLKGIEAAVNKNFVLMKSRD